MKSKVDKFNVDKLKPVPNHLKKSSYIFDKKVVKNMCMMNRLKKLIPLILVDLLKKNRLWCYDVMINKIEGKMSSIAGLATTIALKLVI